MTTIQTGLPIQTYQTWRRFILRANTDRMVMGTLFEKKYILKSFSINKEHLSKVLKAKQTK